MKSIPAVQLEKYMHRRIIKNKIARGIFFLSVLFCLSVLAMLLGRIFTQGIHWINFDFLSGKLSTLPERAGIFGAILGTVWLMLVVIPVTMIIGISSAIYLQLYAKKGRMQGFIQTNIANLAGVPSIVYGILGLTVFVRALDLGSVVLAGGLTMALLILPIVIVASQEAILAVNDDISSASYGIGASKWQTIRHIIIPAALPGILTGAILSLSRAIGETAPLIVIGIPAFLIPFPGSIMDKFTVLPMQIYYWTLDATLVSEYANLAAATIIVLLFCLLFLNVSAVFIRNKFQQK
ncbi:phosphate ABC transporter permease PstA [Virgibacillus halophilus]|uniref:Phosphate transport system permease protein PstA n=1 Tax=Tigheibacillus halophilus TaxID=361280 RepID=A0ABU5C5D0_9BACI|nr:phosphate ABC transporter permease PstA [Virgibacillus halophilus]